MEAKRLKRDVKTLLGEYIGQRLRENGFDPKGKSTFTMLDDLAHYDLAISVALWRLNNDDEKNLVENNYIGIGSLQHISQYPNRLEREAMILSSFAGMLLNSLPIEDILSLYSCKPSASYKGNIVHPFSLSYHPFAMLSSFKAVERSRKHTQALKRGIKEHSKQKVSGVTETLESSSSSSSFSDSEDSLKDETAHYEGSQESLQD
ncbi:hypothetical protein F2P79_006042 [Pimephales promelas]|nr:hypothetical protein F2P79_006042 [Pimephales promelas]KAG1959960.1 hypothetical protein F2P79_006042 [Pimephales promelas]KAG1959961.1 hypothetical protein F2P79_006042 [Pimephales promelas]KAG1959962.1 hypothetical protein F2P79_006042 [Pimephales promelas]KAG1959963.1 hypothetical protein F2P79_006042 [Pimephales promelas]